MYKLAIWILLPSMLLNGVWMVCSTPNTGDAPMSAEEKADCIRICAALEAEFGRICIIWPSDTKASISVIDYGAAILPDEIVVKPIVINEEVPADFSASYGDPVLSNLTPPPKA
jgi:hypothetical protein